MAKRLLRREHIVAASLVGAVVVVVGFASGLGTRPGSEAIAAPEPEDGGGQPAVTAPAPTSQTRTPGGGSTRGPGVVNPVATATNRPPGTGHTAHPPAPTTTTTTPPTTGTTPPSAPCEPGLVPEALDTLLGTLDRATEALGLLGAAPATGLTVAAVPGALPEGTPFDQLVATCPAPNPATPTTTTTTSPGHG